MPFLLPLVMKYAKVIAVIAAVFAVMIALHEYNSHLRMEGAQEQQMAYFIHGQQVARKDASIKAQQLADFQAKLQGIQSTYFQAQGTIAQLKEKARHDAELQKTLDCTLPPADYQQLCQQVHCAGNAPAGTPSSGSSVDAASKRTGP